ARRRQPGRPDRLAGRAHPGRPALRRRAAAVPRHGPRPHAGRALAGADRRHPGLAGEGMIRTMTAAARPTAVLAATTTWQEFPALWRRLLDEVHAHVRWGGPGRKGRNVMLYHDDVPHVEVGVELD